MGSQNTRPFLLPAERPSQRRPTKSSHGHFVSPQDAFQREMEIVKKSKDSLDERRAKDQAAAKVPYFIRKALGDVFDEISHADLVYACKALMDIDEEDGKSWHARTSKKETRARIKRACKFLRAYYKNKALEDKDETCKATIAARDEEIMTTKGKLAVCEGQVDTKDNLLKFAKFELAACKEQLKAKDDLLKSKDEQLKLSMELVASKDELAKAKQASKGQPLACVTNA